MGIIGSVVRCGDVDLLPSTLPLRYLRRRHDGEGHGGRGSGQTVARQQCQRSCHVHTKSGARLTGSAQLPATWTFVARHGARRHSPWSSGGATDALSRPPMKSWFLL